MYLRPSDADLGWTYDISASGYNHPSFGHVNMYPDEYEGLQQLLMSDG